MNEKLDRAVAIRDHVLRLMERGGAWLQRGQVRVRWWEGGDFKAALNTRFSTLPNQPVPYELSVWAWAGGKVLLIDWEHGGEARVVSFKRGEWEDRLLAISAD